MNGFITIETGGNTKALIQVTAIAAIYQMAHDPPSGVVRIAVTGGDPQCPFLTHESMAEIEAKLQAAATGSQE